MNYKEAFLIVEKDENENNEYIIKGRAYIDININDTLYYKDRENILKYKIKRILTYRIETNLLSQMMTGDIIIEGDNFDIIENDCFFYIQSNN